MPPLNPNKDDIQQIYNLIRASDQARSQDHLEVCERLTAVEVKIAALPAQRNRPCEFLEKHKDEHTANAKTWKDNAVSSVFKLCLVAIVAAVTWIIAKMKGS